MRSLHNILCGVLLALYLTALSSPCYAANYFVRVSGNDYNSGTSKWQAFRTIAKAADVGQPGDTIYVGAGTYTNQAIVANNGTSSNPLRFIADSSGVMTGDAGDVICSGTEFFHVEYDDYTQVIGFIFNGGARAVYFKESVGCVLQDCELRNGSDPVYLLDAKATVDNCYIHNNSENGIYLTGSTSTLTVTNSTIQWSSKKGVYINGGTQTTIEDSWISDNSDHGVNLNTSSGTVSISRCILERNKDGIHTHGTFDLNVRNCLIADNSEDGIQIHADSPYVIVYHCTIVDNGIRGVEVEHGTGWIISSIIAYNSSDGLRGPGNNNYYSAYNVLYSNNTNYDNFPGLYYSTDTVADPKFVGGGDYHLQAGSPAIDNGYGSTATDLDGNARPQGAAIDRGCYEFGASTYYVRTGGDDSNSGGSPSNAFRTISKAASVVGEGDTVYVGGGTYNEGVTVQQIATSSDPILFIADTSGAQTGDAGSVIVKPPTSLQYGWTIQSSQYISLDGFRISGSGLSQRNGLLVTGSSNITIENCDIDNVLHGIYGVTSAFTLDNCDVSDTTTAGVWLDNIDDTDIQVSNLTLSNNGSYGLYLDSCEFTFNSSNIGIWASTGSQIVIAGIGSDLTFNGITISGGSTASVQLADGVLNADSTTFSSSGYGLAVDNCTVTLADCTLSGNSIGLYADQNPTLAVTDTSFSSNTQWGAMVYGGGTAGTATFDTCTFNNNDQGISIVNCSTGDVLLRTGTVISDNTNAGLHFNNCNVTVNDQAGGTAWRTLRNGYGISCDGSTVAISNVNIEESSSRGIQCDTSTVTVTNCTITGVNGIYADTSNTSLIVESTSCETTGTGGWGLIRLHGDLSVKNSLFVGFDGGAVMSSSSSANQAEVSNCTFAKLVTYGVGIQSDDATVRNCIIDGAGADDAIFSTGGTLTHSNNLLNGFVNLYNGVTADATEIADDPRFVDAAGGNFRLAKGSPAINAGVDLGLDVPNDIEGNARPAYKAFEIGAYEFNSSNGAFRVIEWQEKK